MSLIGTRPLLFEHIYKVKNFPDKKKLKESIIPKSALNEMLKDLLLEEDKKYEQ